MSNNVEMNEGELVFIITSEGISLPPATHECVDAAIEGVKAEIESLEAQNASLRAELSSLLALARKSSKEKYTEVLDKYGAFLASIGIEVSE